MRAIVIIGLLWINAQLLTAACGICLQSFARYAVERREANYQYEVMEAVR